MTLTESVKPQRVLFAYIVGAILAIGSMLLPNKGMSLVNPESVTNASPEDLTIEILDRQVTIQGQHEHIRLRASVLAVRKSETGLVPGDLIEIVYTRDLRALKKIGQWFEERAKQPGWAGDTPPFPPAAPEVGRKLRAYLRLSVEGEARAYEPAANQYSFEPTEDAPRR